MELALETLKKFGLPPLEAQAYIYLAKKGPCTEKELAQTTKLDTTQLNHILMSLQTKGFIIYLATTCSVVSAVPLEVILDNLEKAKLAEAQHLQQSRDKILATSEPKNN